jgi:hypothetical protein
MWGKVIIGAVIVLLVVVWLAAVWLVLTDPQPWYFLRSPRWMPK